MPKFRHPCVTHGVVQTPAGRFMVTRGIVDAPEDVGALCGWTPVDPAEHVRALRVSAPTATGPSTARDDAGRAVSPHP
jgi:hypothetical protein